jgi:hypothetical protein
LAPTSVGLDVILVRPVVHAALEPDPAVMHDDHLSSGNHPRKPDGLFADPMREPVGVFLEIAFDPTPKRLQCWISPGLGDASDDLPQGPVHLPQGVVMLFEAAGQFLGASQASSNLLGHPEPSRRADGPRALGMLRGSPAFVLREQ